MAEYLERWFGNRELQQIKQRLSAVENVTQQNSEGLTRLQQLRGEIQQALEDAELTLQEARSQVNQMQILRNEVTGQTNQLETLVPDIQATFNAITATQNRVETQQVNLNELQERLRTDVTGFRSEAEEWLETQFQAFTTQLETWVNEQIANVQSALDSLAGRVSTSLSRVRATWDKVQGEFADIQNDFVAMRNATTTLFNQLRHEVGTRYAEEIGNMSTSDWGKTLGELIEFAQTTRVIGQNIQTWTDTMDTRLNNVYRNYVQIRTHMKGFSPTV